MNSVRRNASAGLLALAALAACVAARADTVTLRDGTTLEGIIMIETDTKIVLKQATGSRIVLRDDITGIERGPGPGGEHLTQPDQTANPPRVHNESVNFFAAPSGDADPLLAYVVRVTSTIVEPDFLKPWTRSAPRTVTASGVFVGYGQIYTTAQAVAYASEVQVQIGPSGEKIPAAVLDLDRELDFGMLQVKSPGFDEKIQGGVKVTGLRPQTNERVTLYGFSEGESNVSAIPAFVDRIDYAPPGSRYEGMHLFINKGFKPGVEGGPVFNEQSMLMGLAARGANGAIFVTPFDEIHNYLRRETGVANQGIDPRPAVAQHFEHLENPALRASLGIGPSIHGMLVSQVEGSASTNPFMAMDVVTDIGDAKVDDVGDVLLSTGMRLSYGYAIQATLTHTTNFTTGTGSAKQTLGSLSSTSVTAKEHVVPFRVIRGGNAIDLSVPMSSPNTALLRISAQATRPTSSSGLSFSRAPAGS